MKLIVGLGNPGKKYEDTRHNFGFMAVEALAKRLGASWRDAPAHKGEIAEARHDSLGKIFLFKPQTFMNLSGEAVVSLTAFYKIEAHDVLAIYDDLDLPLGRIRFATKGSAAGHNGVKSMIQHLSTQEFARLKLGIGRPLHPGHEVVDYVLQRFSKEERALADKVIALAGDAAISCLDHGLARAMNRYNGMAA